MREGVQEFGRGNFVEARALFEQAHAAQPSARTFRGLGLCAYELKHYKQAISELEAAVSDKRNSLNDEQRLEVHEAIEKARRYVGFLQIEVEPADATILVDGRPAATRTLELDAGDYVVSASAPGYKSGEQRVTVSGSRNLTAYLVLRRLDSLEHAADVDQSRSAPAHASARDEAGGGTWPWIVTGISGAVVVGGAVLLALAMDDVSTVENARKGIPFSELESAYDGAPVKSAAGFALLGVGAAGVAIGLFWALDVDEPQATVGMAFGPGRLVLKGSF